MSNEIKLADVAEEQSLKFSWRQVKQHAAFRLAMQPFDFVTDTLSSAWRLVTNPVRHLPTTLIIGAQRAGTTQLYSYLVKHPRCYGAAEKEVDYFSAYPHRSVAWYRSRFPWRRRVWRRQAHVLEASPSYLPDPSALRNMQKILPNARIIVLLRDPVSRAFSHYQQQKTGHVAPRSFAEVVDDEIRTNPFPAKWGAALADEARPMSGYVARGYYALQLELLFKLYRKNRVLVIDSASLFADTAAVCNRVFDFCGLEDFDVEPSIVYNRGIYRETIDPRVAERLRDHYRPYDTMLQEIVEKPFEWMAAPRAMAA